MTVDRLVLETLYRDLQDFVEHASDIDSLILTSRILNKGNQQTLQNIADRFGFTKEAIRQRQTRLESTIDQRLSVEGHELAQSLSEELDEICYTVQVVGRLESVLRIREIDIRLLRFLVGFLLSKAGYTRFGFAYVTQHVVESLDHLKVLAQDCAQMYGYVDRATLIEGLTDTKLRVHWVWFEQQLKLRRVFQSYSSRNNRSVKAYAAITSLHRPVSKPELSEMCEINTKVASSLLSLTETVTQSSRMHWTITDWGLHPYRGIVNEMLSYIEARGGQANRTTLIQAISTKFDVKPESLATYLQTPKFELVHDSVRVVKNPEANIKWSNFAKGLDTTASGNLSFSFKIHPRNLRGFSIVGVPFRFSKAVGCPFDGHTDLIVQNLPDCEVTIQAHLASTTQASIGYVTNAFIKANLKAGDEAYFECISKNVVELHRKRSNQL